MHPSTIAAFFKFTELLEGRVYSMYLDVKGLVTTGAGNLIDPAAAALRLPWRLPDGSFASKDEIMRQWVILKARQDLAKLDFSHAAKLTTIRLTEEDVDALVMQKLLENERYLRQALPGWDEFPADAQLGCCSIAWAVGAGFTATFKNFTRAANEQDWNAAKLSCKISTEGNRGIVPRNAANERCFANAAFVREKGLPIDVLYWPSSAAAASASTPPRAPAPPAAEDQARVEAARLKAKALSLQIDDIGVNRADFLRELSGVDSRRPEPEPGEGVA